jgi:hypothetical protein
MAFIVLKLSNNFGARLAMHKSKHQSMECENAAWCRVCFATSSQQRSGIQRPLLSSAIKSHNAKTIAEYPQFKSDSREERFNYFENHDAMMLIDVSNALRQAHFINLKRSFEENLAWLSSVSPDVNKPPWTGSKGSWTKNLMEFIVRSLCTFSSSTLQGPTDNIVKAIRMKQLQLLRSCYHTGTTQMSTHMDQGELENVPGNDADGDAREEASETALTIGPVSPSSISELSVPESGNLLCSIFVSAVYTLLFFN